MLCILTNTLQRYSVFSTTTNIFSYFFAKNVTLLTYVNQKSKITTYIPILFIENGK